MKSCAAEAKWVLDRPGKKQKKKQPSKTSKINKAIPNKLPQTEDFSFLFFPLQKKHFKNHGG
jgi:hypothetical protein